MQSRTAALFLSYETVTAALSARVASAGPRLAACPEYRIEDYAAELLQ
jgi:hypothetical protein